LFDVQDTVVISGSFRQVCVRSYLHLEVEEMSSVTGHYIKTDSLGIIAVLDAFLSFYILYITNFLIWKDAGQKFHTKGLVAFQDLCEHEIVADLHLCPCVAEVSRSAPLWGKAIRSADESAGADGYEEDSADGYGDADSLLDAFLNDEIPAVLPDTGKSYYFSDLYGENSTFLPPEDGDRLDLDNDGEPEQILRKLWLGESVIAGTEFWLYQESSEQ